jgi:competence protein ComEC
MSNLSSTFRRLPILKYLIPVIAGIIYQLYFPVKQDFILIALSIALFFLLSFSIYYRLKILRLPLLWGIASTFVFFSIGLWTTCLKQEEVRIDDDYIRSSAFIATIDDTPVQKSSGLTLNVNVNSICVESAWKSCNVKCLLTIKNDSAKQFEVGDNLLVNSRMTEPSGISFPMQFDFRKYLKLKGIPLVAYARQGEVAMLPEKSKSIAYVLLHIRKLMLDKIATDGFEKREQAVLSSLLLGFMGDLDPDLKNAYSTAGVMHILSVSGLHVGIVYLFLMSILFFLKRNKKLDLLRYTLAIAGIWFYALISGFSTPVIRSATMFSFIAMGQFVNRQSNPLNNLAISALLILLVNPFQLYDVGFQLSYTAMAGIFLFYQPIYQSISIDNWWLDKIWELVAVSLAAQLATMPITLYYFHTFPVYFLLANLVIVPLSSIILYLGIFLMLFSFWNIVATWIAFILNYILFGLNWLVLTIEKLPYASISNIYMDGLNMFLLFIIILSLTYIMINKDLRMVNLVFASTLVLTCNLSFAHIEAIHNKNLIVGKIGQTPVISIVEGNKIIHITTSDKTDLLQKNLKNFNIVKLISKEEIIDIKAVKAKTEIVVNGIRIYRESENDYMIGFENRCIYVTNNKALSMPENDRLILVINSPDVLKKINPMKLINLQIIALNDRNPTNRIGSTGNDSIYKNAYFVNRQGAFLIEL